MSGVPAYLRYANQGATRSLPLDPNLVSALGFLGDMGVTAEVFSGGQPGKGSGGKRVGSTRHDHGNAGDFRFYQGDRQLDWGRDEDRPVFEEIVRRGKAAGITGFGAGPGYMGAGTMHVGFGSPGVWGAGGRGANAPDWLRAAYGEPAARGGGGAASALQTAMAERAAPAGPAAMTGAMAMAPEGPSSPSSPNSNGGGDMAAPTVEIGIKPRKSTKLQEAMLGRLLESGQNIRHPLELAGNLAQVWALNGVVKDAEAGEVSELQKAYAAANLDPAYAMMAQLSGTREGLADAIRSQETARIDADNRTYDRNQDALANARADAELEITRANANKPADAPSGYRYGGAGLEPIPGGPADPSRDPAFRQATPEEASDYGAAGGQFGPDGRFYPVNPPSNGVTVSRDGTVQIGGQGMKLTEGQSKDLNYFTRGSAALPTIEANEAALASAGQRAADGVPLVGNYLTSEAYQVANQAGREFLAAVLRKDTGAAITREEFELYGPMFLPQPGDGADVIEQKRAARTRAMEAMRNGLGSASPMADMPVTQNPGSASAPAGNDPLGIR